jgi:ABC-type bacteriocin/lantibiotic exporter with double-glycine peptidase domain
LKDINFEIDEGQTVAIVGPSGSGKTTLVDVILGVLQPNIGNVELSGSTPQDAINNWPGAIS